MGAGAAGSWGVGDFTARFLGRAIGVPQGLFGMMLVGSLAVGLYIVVSGETLVWELSGLWLLALNGVATMLATLMLFEALTRGPVSLGSPMVSSYPAFAVPITVVFGARPRDHPLDCDGGDARRRLAGGARGPRASKAATSRNTRRRCCDAPP